MAIGTTLLGVRRRLVERTIDEGLVLQQQLAILSFDISGQGRLTSPEGEPFAPRAIECEGDDRVAEPAGIAGMDQEAVLVVAHAFGESSGVGRDHGQARCHRFEGYEAASLCA